nr:MAG TPA: hypothetical protein [Bacteriophage sp.]
MYIQSRIRADCFPIYNSCPLPLILKKTPPQKL